jgi:sec-independent protein translocase protein TatB
VFDIGFAELLVCAIVGLLVLGPERLPGAVRTVGRWVGKARHTVSQFSDQIDRELRADELKKRIEEEVRKAGVADVSRQVNEALRAPLAAPLVGASHLRDGNAANASTSPAAASTAPAAASAAPVATPPAPAAEPPDALPTDVAAEAPAATPVATAPAAAATAAPANDKPQ